MRWIVALPVAVYLAGAALQAVVPATTGGGDGAAALALGLLLLGLPVAVGCLLGRRVPASPVGAALAWVGAAPSAVFALEWWGKSARTPHPWPAAQVLYQVQAGAWVWNLAGFAALCFVFPDGPLPGRRWRCVGWLAVAAGVYVNAEQALIGPPGEGQPVTLSPPVVAVNAVAALLGCLVALSLIVGSLVVRYRGADPVVRGQLRWLVLGAGTVPVLLALGWVLQWLGASPAVAFLGLFAALLVAVPAAVAVAVLRHDLFDVDRLLGSSLAWLLTTIGSAAVFALAVTIGARLGAGSRAGATGAAFVTALALLPMHRRLNTAVGRLVDRDRYVVDARIQQFVRAVRDGTAEPEETQEVFRAALADPGLRLLLRRPGIEDVYVDLAGSPAQVDEAAGGVPLSSGGTVVGRLVLGINSARRLRRAREVALAARLPIEVSRLRLELREALRDVRDSRTRLVSTAAEERRRLEQNLHDGAQQQIVSVGMRLRSTQRRLDPGSAEYRDLDAAVEALEATIAELRRLAHGLRPRQLDDGLPAALRTLVADAPLPVHLDIADVTTTDVVATTAYFVVAEAYANALKHARAARIDILLTETRPEPERGQASGDEPDPTAKPKPETEGQDTIHIEVTDDGVGSARELTSVRDRVASLGGDLTVVSPPGAGTRVLVRIPAHPPAPEGRDAHRRR